MYMAAASRNKWQRSKCATNAALLMALMRESINRGHMRRSSRYMASALARATTAKSSLRARDEAIASGAAHRRNALSRHVNSLIKAWQKNSGGGVNSDEAAHAVAWVSCLRGAKMLKCRDGGDADM